MNIDNLTFGELKQIAAMFNGQAQNKASDTAVDFIGKSVLVRTYSAGVHIGTLVKANGMECQLKDALRLWKWEGGGLSLSAVATNGIKGGRLNKTGEVFLTNAIEYIFVTEKALESFSKYIEDKE